MHIETMFEQHEKSYENPAGCAIIILSHRNKKPARPIASALHFRDNDGTRVQNEAIV
ncbi:hypothetical protein SDC9_81353 [bioreactor metagenome]|uniref:Uncharacterized protein n=1 Tax=bioreactor metagenome TaxID=1076179 RepID=A0A644Z1Q5_9ZZZZ